MVFSIPGKTHYDRNLCVSVCHQTFYIAISGISLKLIGHAHSYLNKRSAQYSDDVGLPIGSSRSPFIPGGIVNLLGVSSPKLHSPVLTIEPQLAV
ncbi:hypothetical protein BYT27DRAFT_7195883 [Phlegmacium glaucopus]|nr:hypothetical protein BYT27DRAFT_7195883 [Phlegmacium glaucopus]